MQPLVGGARDLLLHAERLQCRSTAFARLALQQAAEVVARLEALGQVEHRQVPAVAGGVELAQRVEAVHVAEVEHPDLLAVVEQVAGAEVPLEQAGEQQLGAQREHLAQLPGIPAVDQRAGNPWRQHDAVVQRRIQRVGHAAQALAPAGQGLQRFDLPAPLQLVQERGLPVDVLHQALGPSLLQGPAAPADAQVMHPGRESAGQGAHHMGLVAAGGCQHVGGQGTRCGVADLERAARGQERQLMGLAPCIQCRGGRFHLACGDKS
jgi:hypothetical protein